MDRRVLPGASSLANDETERRLADLAGQLRAVSRVDDRPRVNEVTGPAREDLLSLEKERPQLRIEDAESAG